MVTSINWRRLKSSGSTVDCLFNEVLRKALAALSQPLVVAVPVRRYVPMHQILAQDAELDRGSVKRLFKVHYKIMSLPLRRVKSMSHPSSRVAAVALAFLLLVATVLAKAADPPSCKAVRI